MHKPNYGYEKHQKELKKQNKQEEKRRRKLEKKADLLPEEEGIPEEIEERDDDAVAYSLQGSTDK